MHATPTAVNEEALCRHVERARSAGATDADIADVLFTISAVANHALYFSVPLLEEELRSAGLDDDRIAHCRMTSNRSSATSSPPVASGMRAESNSPA